MFLGLQNKKHTAIYRYHREKIYPILYICSITQVKKKVKRLFVKVKKCEQLVSMPSISCQKIYLRKLFFEWTKRQRQYLLDSEVPEYVLKCISVICILHLLVIEHNFEKNIDKRTNILYDK